MMRQMRENTKWIMLITALAFVALMVFEWGMDMTGRSAGGLGEIGRVNGTPVMYDEYQATYRQLYDRAQSAQEEALSSQQNRDIEDAAFNQVVNQILIQQELERRGLRVTDDEILQAARFSPPPEIRQLFMGEGGFDLASYQRYISSPSADPAILQFLETYYRDQIPRLKLLRQVTTGLYLTDQELWNRWRTQNEAVTVRYLSMDPARRIPADEVAVSDEEVRSYYEANQEEFEVPARAEVKAVLLRKAATPEDTVAQLERAHQIALDLRNGEATWDEVAALESADRESAAAGGDIGIVTPGQLVPRLDTAIFDGPLEEISDPIETRFGLHVVEVRERWDRDSARVRQVLIEYDRTDESEIRLLTMADSLEDLGENRSLDEAARILGRDVVEARITQDLPFVPGAGQVGEGADWAFEEASPGDVSPVFENDQAFYALELVERTPAGVLPLDEVETRIRRTLVDRKRIERAEEEAREILARIREGTPMVNVASDMGLQVGTAGPFTRTSFVPGLGRRNAAVGTAFGLEVGEVSDVVTTSNDVVILEKIGHTPADSAAWVAQKDGQRQRLAATLREQRLQQWLAGLREQANIVDRRDEVLQPADEEAPLRQPAGGFGF